VEAFTDSSSDVTPKSVRREEAVGNTWYVTFQSEAHAIQAILEASRKKIHGSAIHARIKSETRAPVATAKPNSKSTTAAATAAPPPPPPFRPKFYAPPHPSAYIQQSYMPSYPTAPSAPYIPPPPFDYPVPPDYSAPFDYPVPQDYSVTPQDYYTVIQGYTVYEPSNQGYHPAYSPSSYYDYGFVAGYESVPSLSPNMHPQLPPPHSHHHQSEHCAHHPHQHGAGMQQQSLYLPPPTTQTAMVAYDAHLPPPDHVYISNAPLPPIASSEMMVPLEYNAATSRKKRTKQKKGRRSSWSNDNSYHGQEQQQQQHHHQHQHQHHRNYNLHRSLSRHRQYSFEENKENHHLDGGGGRFKYRNNYTPSLLGHDSRRANRVSFDEQSESSGRNNYRRGGDGGRQKRSGPSLGRSAASKEAIGSGSGDGDVDENKKANDVEFPALVEPSTTFKRGDSSCSKVEGYAEILKKAPVKAPSGESTAQDQLAKLQETLQEELAKLSIGGDVSLSGEPSVEPPPTTKKTNHQHLSDPAWVSGSTDEATYDEALWDYWQRL
jgi:hypothetical protein